MIISVVADFDEKITEMSDYTIRVPIENDQSSIAMSPVPFAFPLQIMAYFAADYNELDPNKPRIWPKCDCEIDNKLTFYFF